MVTGGGVQPRTHEEEPRALSGARDSPPPAAGLDLSAWRSRRTRRGGRSVQRQSMEPGSSCSGEEARVPSNRAGQVRQVEVRKPEAAAGGQCVKEEGMDSCRVDMGAAMFPMERPSRRERSNR